MWKLRLPHDPTWVHTHQHRIAVIFRKTQKFAPLVTEWGQQAARETIWMNVMMSNCPAWPQHYHVALYPTRSSTEQCPSSTSLLIRKFRGKPSVKIKVATGGYSGCVSSSRTLKQTVVLKITCRPSPPAATPCVPYQGCEWQDNRQP